jgi:hypothetical protein
MTEPVKTPASGEMWSHFDLGEATKVVSIVAAFAYATGVIAINTYLHGLGIVDFSFAKPKLLLTGIVVLCTYLLLAFPAFFLAWSIATYHEQTPRRLSSLSHIVVLFVGSLILLLVASAICCWRGHPGMGQTAIWELWKRIDLGQSSFKRIWVSILVALEVYLPIFVAAVSLYVTARLLDQERTEGPTPRISLRRFSLAVAAAVFVVAAIGYIYIFTLTFYPVIPQEFGGGKPYFESFAIATEDICQLRQLGIPFASTNTTQPLPVLHETDTLVAVWLKQSATTWDFVVAELGKGQIKAARVENATSVEAAEKVEYPARVDDTFNPLPPPLVESEVPCKD